jgi:hypothetical protein
MRIYISGRITGLPFIEVEAKFQQAEWLLEELGLEPVNPLKNGLTVEHPWNEHMVKDIEMLLPCEGVLMLDNWTESTGAGIEYDIAMRMGKDVWFETNVAHNHEVVMGIQRAIHEVTGLKFCEYTTESRKREKFFARMMFAYHCQKNDIDPMQYIRRDRTMVYHYLNQYHDEIKFNPYFKKMAMRVEAKLNPKTTEHVSA